MTNHKTIEDIVYAAHKSALKTEKNPYAYAIKISNYFNPHPAHDVNLLLEDIADYYSKQENPLLQEEISANKNKRGDKNRCPLTKFSYLFLPIS